MLPDHFLDPINLVLVLSIVLAFMSVQQKNRRRMLSIKFGGDILYGAYMIAIGGLSGGLASFIAATGGLIQIAIPEHKLDQTLKLRLAIALGLSALAVAVSVREMSDILPILGLVVARFVETQKDPQRIRIGFLVSATPWAVYNVVNHFYWPLIYNIIIATSLLVAIIRHKEPVTPKEIV